MALAHAGPVADDWASVSAWARSGAMGLGGSPEGLPPCLPPVGLVARIESLVSEIEELTRRRGRPVSLSWAAALAGRADFMDLRRRGQVSANGSCRLLPTLDGWVALNLPRPDDLELIPALVGGVVGDPWEAVAAEASGVSSDELVARARLLGLAASVLPTPEADSVVEQPYELIDCWSKGPADADGPVRVLDLSPLWAGPMVTRVLAESGAEVTRLVSTGRHEGAALGTPFYRWIHSPRESRVEVDLRTPVGRRDAATLISEADVVIEGSRPRALEQLGLGPGSYSDRTARVWLSVTGHGRRAPGRDWIAFGDDAAVAGGLVAADQKGRPAFVGDAIADPLTGLTGALAVLRSLASGGGGLIDLSMSKVAATMAASGEGASVAPRGRALDGVATVESGDDGSWLVRSGGRTEAVRDRPETAEWITGEGSGTNQEDENRS